MSDFLISPTTTSEDRPDVSALAGDVVSILRDSSRRKDQRRLVDATAILEHRVLEAVDFSAEDAVTEILRAGCTGDEIIEFCIPRAARNLGNAWCSDSLSFAKVTIGSARLQGLLTVLAPPWSNTAVQRNSPTLLMVIPDGGAHTLGPHVAIAQLRRRNACVSILFAPSDETLLRTLTSDSFDGVLFSCDSEARLRSIGLTISAIKHSIPAAPPTILGGLALDLVSDANARAGADLATNDAVEALTICVNRMKSAQRSRKCRATRPNS